MDGKGLLCYNLFMKKDDYRLKRYAEAAQTSKVELQQPLIKTAQSAKDSLTKTLDELTKQGLVKVPLSSKPEEKESIFRRVAKFLLIIGIDEAAKILPHLLPEQVDKIALEIASIRSVDEDEAALILAEFESLVQKSRESGGVETAYEILEKAFGPERAEALIQKKIAFPKGKPFEYLQEADTEKIQQLLHDESDAIRSLVLSQLPPRRAADYIQALPQAEKTSLVHRLATLNKIDTEVLVRVDSAMREKTQRLSIEKADSIDGKAALVEILKKMPGSGDLRILSSIENSDPDLSREIKEQLFSMTDILKADDRFIQKKLQEMEDASIAYLIAGKSETFRLKILGNISKGRKALVLEEENMRKPMKKRDVDEVTLAFFTLLRKAWENGELILHDSSDILVY